LISANAPGQGAAEMQNWTGVENGTAILSAELSGFILPDSLILELAQVFEKRRQPPPFKGTGFSLTPHKGLRQIQMPLRCGLSKGLN